MSSVPPPPPPPQSPPPPPSGFPVPPPSGFQGPPPSPGAGAIPTGYVAYGQPSVAMGAVKPSAGLSKAMIILFWLTTAAAAFLTVAFFMRKSVWSDLIGGGDVSFQDLDDADGLVGAAAVLQILIEIAAVIMVCLWSKRIADNAKARGVTNVSPGLAAGGWFIPIGWFFVGFDQLRKAVTGVRGAAPNLIRWQVAFIASGIGGFVAYTFGGDIDLAESETEVSDILQRQGIVAAISTALFAICTIFAMKAAKELDSTVSGQG